MSVVKRFLAFDAQGNVIEQTDGMTIEVDAGTSPRSIVNKSQLDAEAAAREAADTALGNSLLAALNAETANRQAADTTLTQALADEQAARLAQDTVLAGLISAEEAARIAADSAEATARSAADTTLQGNIDAEAARALAAEGVLSAAITTEATARAAADTALQTALDAEVTRATAAEAAEATARANAVSALQGEIDAEEVRAAAAEATLTTNLAAEVTRATAAEAALQGEIDAEETRAAAAEATLTTNLAAEVTRATAAEGALAADLAAEASARSSADTAEASARQAADDTLTGALAAEVSRATARENAIETALNEEITRATAEEIAVENRAKAYADARVQGLKPKDSVDFAIPKFVPGYYDTAASEYVFQPKFTSYAGNSGTDIAFNYMGDLDLEGSPVLFPDTDWGANSIVGSLVYVHSEPRQLLLAIKTPARGGAGWTYASPDTTLIAAAEGAALPAGVNPNITLRNASLNNDGVALIAFNDFGYWLDPVMPLMVDLTEGTGAVLGQYLSTVSAFFPMDMVLASGSRVVIVQPNIGSPATGGASTPASDASGTGVHDAFMFISSATVENAAAGTKTSTYDSIWFDSAKRLGIYQATVTDGEMSWARAPDFATGMDVSGAFFTVEKSLTTIRLDNKKEVDGFNSQVLQLTSNEQFFKPNIALIVSSLNDSSLNAVVGGSVGLTFSVFNRIGSYSFNNGFERDNAYDFSSYAVKPNMEAGIRVSSNGVAVELRNSHGKKLSSVPHADHLSFTETLGGASWDKGLAFTSPLASGPHATSDMFHSHKVNLVTYEINTSTPGFATAQQINENYLWNMGRGTVVKIDPATGLPTPANYDSNDIVGVVFSTEDASEDNESAPIDQLTGQRFVNKGYIHIAVGGVVELGYGVGLHPHGVDLDANPELDFAVNEIAYLGAGQAQYVRFADVPAGKWAIPVYRKLNSLEAMILDRPATLKA